MAAREDVGEPAVERPLALVDDPEAAGQPVAGRAGEGDDALLAGGGGDRLQRVAERGLGEAGRLRRIARGASAASSSGRAEVTWR